MMSDTLPSKTNGSYDLNRKITKSNNFRFRLVEIDILNNATWQADSNAGFAHDNSPSNDANVKVVSKWFVSKDQLRRQGFPICNTI